MAEGKSAWFVLADAKKARLMRCDQTPLSRAHIETKEQMAYQWEGHEHGRPTPLAGKSANTYAAVKHDQEEQLRRFAKQVAAWLDDQRQAHQIERLEVFAPPRFMAALRRAMEGPLAEAVREHDADLINLPLGQLHEHPAVRQLIGL